jgi:hypothetical protein
LNNLLKKTNGLICLKRILILLFAIIIIPCLSQNTSDSLIQKNTVDSITQHQKIVRRSILLGSLGSFTVGSYLFLDELWYKQYATSSFHFFNDNLQWCQMDKFGHAFSTYSSACLIWQSIEWAGFEASPKQATVGHFTTGAMRWAGFTRKQSIIAGELFGLLYLSSVEILDGFSKGWGFSWGDEVANFGGGFLFSLQQYYWKEQRIRLKFSYHPTSYPYYRPSILGTNAAEEIIKDYNGQTYWLSINPASFFKEGTKFPKWLNLDFGYGATGMISGRSNEIINNMNNTISYGTKGSQTSELINSDGSIQYFTRHRSVFFSLDVDLKKIKTKSKFLKGVFNIFNCFKIPFPAIEFSKENKFSFHTLYF